MVGNRVQAASALADFIAGRPVRCELVGRDAFNRALGVCFGRLYDRWSANHASAGASLSILKSSTLASQQTVLQTNLQTNCTTQDDTGHHKPGLSTRKCQTRPHA
jgi:hypothetical protein